MQNRGGRPDGDDADQRPAGEAQVPAPHHQQLRPVQQAPQVVPLTRLQQCNQGQSIFIITLASNLQEWGLRLNPIFLPGPEPVPARNNNQLGSYQFPIQLRPFFGQ